MTITPSFIFVVLAVLVAIGIALYFFARSVFENAKAEFTTRTLVLIPIAIAINIAIGELVVRLKLPIYLDSIGTVLVGALAGPWAGMATGALANLIWGFINPVLAPFFYVAAVIGLMAGFFGKRGVFERETPRWISTLIGAIFFFTLAFFITAFLNRTTDETGYTTYPTPGALLSSYLLVFIVAILVGAAVGYFFLQKGGYAGLAGLVTGVVAAIISAPTAAIVFGGVTGAGTDLLVAAFRASGAGIASSVLAQGVVSDPFDKMLSFMVVWLILRSLPTRFRAR
jgi:energy-coupling factor transport system substrate-specific component